MLRLKTLSIQSLLLLMTLVTALPAAGIIIYSGMQFRNELLDDARLDTLKLTERIASEQQNMAFGAEQLMMTLAQLPEVKNRDAATVGQILRELHKLNPRYSNITIADRNGRVWATAVPTVDPVVIADRRYFRSAVATGRLSSGEYVISRATAKPSFHLAYAVKDGQGSVIAVISVNFQLHHYRQLLQSLQMPRGTSFVLIDHRGTILYRGIAAEKYMGKPYPAEYFRQIKEGPDLGSIYRVGLEGDERIISFRKLRLKGEQTPYLYVTAGIPLDAATQQARRSLQYSVGLLMSFLLLASAGAFWIGKRAISDRFKLLERSARLVAGGDLHVRVSHLVGGGEFGSLGKSFDAMAADLAKREGERLKAEEEQQNLIAMLGNANQELEAFNYTVAHDLRQPLNLLSSYSQFIDRMCGSQLSKECREHVVDIYKTTLRMNSLIVALLNFSRMGQVQPRREAVDLSALAHEAALSRKMAEPGKSVDLHIADGIVATGDVSLLRVVLDNLIGNAWKYTSCREKAVIEFGVKDVDGAPVYFVRDNGPGFDEEDARKIFTPFQRLPGTEAQKGFGIGLATVQRIIRKHGGEVWAEGTPGEGACFYFTLSA